MTVTRSSSRKSSSWRIERYPAICTDLSFTPWTLVPRPDGHEARGSVRELLYASAPSPLGSLAARSQRRPASDAQDSTSGTAKRRERSSLPPAGRGGRRSPALPCVSRSAGQRTGESGSPSQPPGAPLAKTTRPRSEDSTSGTDSRRGRQAAAASGVRPGEGRLPPSTSRFAGGPLAKEASERRAGQYVGYGQAARAQHPAASGPRRAAKPGFAGRKPPPSSEARGGGGGNRTRVRGRTGQSVYERSPHFSSRPDGRCASDLPPGQPSCGLAPPAIGSPSGPARFLTPLPGPRAELGATRHLIT